LAAARYPLSLRLDTADTLLNLKFGINDCDGVLSSTLGERLRVVAHTPCASTMEKTE
jgi:hypothetical protein